MSLHLRILGASSCANCENLKKNCMQAVEELGIKAKVEKVEDIAELLKLGVMQTPALVINGELVSYGRVPEKEEVKEWIKKYL